MSCVVSVKWVIPSYIRQVEQSQNGRHSILTYFQMMEISLNRFACNENIIHSHKKKNFYREKW